MNNRKFGIVGEKIAQKYLIDKKYRILQKNYYTKKGEIDIIAKKDNCIIFVEVKSRSNLNFGTPAMAVNNTKIRHIKNSAKIFLHLNKLYKHEIRFDVIEIFINNRKCKINHIKGAM